jgi:hypothetical protein
MHHIPLGRFRLPVPRTKALRISSGGLFVILGLFGFLPLLGFWMIPVGLLLLSFDIPQVRRMRRIAVVRWHRAQQRSED